MYYYDKKISPSMYEKKHLSVDLELKMLHADGKFSGYASVFDVLDNHHDVIRKGAFQSTLAKGADQVKLLWQHKQDEPIGVFTRMFEDDLGLYVEGTLLLDVQRAKEAYTFLKQGVVKGLSIGYSPVHYQVDSESGARELTEVELWEVSLVTFPANAAANVTVVKSAGEHVPPSDMVDLCDAVERAGQQLVLDLRD